MKKYFIIVAKSLFKIFPFVLAVTLILFSGLGIVFGEVIKLDNESEENQVFKVGITGDTQNNYFQLGKAALQTFDSSRFAIEIVEMNEKLAREKLQDGEISAYVIIPDGFIEKAFYGEIKSIKYITTSGSIGMVSIFKDEITRAVEELLVQSQKGVFGLQNTLYENGFGNEANIYVDDLNIKYVEYIIHRSNMYNVTELGVADGLSFAEYLLCGIIVLFILLAQLPFAVIFVKRDYSINKMLAGKSVCDTKQVISEFFALFITFLTLVAIVLGTLFIILISTELQQIFDMVSMEKLLRFAMGLIPVIALSSAISILIFGISNNILNGVLTHFFSSLSLCYISGCLYPIYSFPKIVQNFSVYLPTGIARGFLANCITEENFAFNSIGLCLYTCLFITLAIIIRKIKIKDKG